jgi:hypothetical protein
VLRAGGIPSTLIFLAAFACLAHAATVHVPGDQPTIQLGISAATIGDTILVAPGVYAESIDFVGKAVTVGSWYLTTSDTSYIRTTAIDGGETLGPLATFSSGEDSLSMLVGMTLQRGSGIYGGAVYCDGGSPRISRCALVSNEAQYRGGAVCAFDADFILEDCRIEGNTAVSQSGGGVYMDAGSPRISGCSFLGNHSGATGGAILCWESSPAVIDNVIEENSSSGSYAGGMYCRDSTPIIARNVFSNNSAGGIAGGLFY